MAIGWSNTVRTAPFVLSRRSVSREDVMSDEQPAAESQATHSPQAASSLLTADDLHLFNEGTHYRLYEKLGAHPQTRDGVAGTYFAVWAPNARRVAVMGAFSRWLPDAHPLQPRGGSGIWEGFVAGTGAGAGHKV